jgi:hypothetical protein
MPRRAKGTRLPFDRAGALLDVVCPRAMKEPTMLFVVRGMLLAVLFVGAGCGGGGGGNLVSITLTSDPAVDGFTTQGGGFAVGFVLVGDEVGNDGIRGLYRFPLAALPAGASISSATLNVNQFEASTGSPYDAAAGLGNLQVESVDISLGLNAGLDQDDYATAALSAIPGNLSTSAALGPRSLTVTGAVQADRAAGRLTSDFRVRFTSQTNGNGAADQVKLNSGSDNGGTGAFPTLVIRYTP